MSECDIEAGLQDLADADNLGRLEAELGAKAAPSEEWILRMAEKEGNGCTSVGGLAIALGEPAIRNVEIVDGYLIDSLTGEVLEYVGEPRFSIDSEDKAEWAMHKRMDAVREVESLKAKRRAILDNLDRQIRQAEGRVRALDYRFGEDLTAFARTRLSGKRRSWACPYGTVAFRRTKARWTWSDAPDAKERAVRWAYEHFNELAESEGLVRVTVSQAPMLAAITEKLECLEEQGAGEEIKQASWAFLSFVPEGETVKIETGVK